jgi:hypothetical protein
VHADALAARHKTADRVGRRRLAAFGQLGHQRIHAHHQHTAACRRAGRARFFDQQKFVCGCAGSGGRSTTSMLRSENSSLPTTSNKASAESKAQLRGQSSQWLTEVLPSRCSSFSTASRPRATVSPMASALNQARTLARARWLARKAQLRIEPVARRAALLHRGDFHRLPVLSGVFSGTMAPSTRAHPRQRWPRWCARCRQIHRGGALGQLHDGGVGRQHVDAVVKQALLAFGHPTNRAPRPAAGAARRSWRRIRRWR